MGGNKGMKGCKKCQYYSIIYDTEGYIVGVHCFKGHPITCSTMICPDYQRQRSNLYSKRMGENMI